MTSAFEQSFKKRLQLLAQERSLTPAEVWQNVIIERFLARLCKSAFHSHFILKGGILLARHFDIGRETKDLDFAIQCLNNEIGVLQNVFRDIVKVEITDGFIFMNPIVSPLEHFHMQYPGAHVTIDVHFGKAKFPLFIDLAFGDVVEVCEQKIFLLSNSKGPLFETSVIMNCYPMEFVFAEKLETVIYRGADNSRMKDYHDLFTLISNEKSLNKNQVISAIRAVFSHRETPFLLPIHFDASALNRLQAHWLRYHQGATKSKRLPKQILQVIEMINEWIGLLPS